MKPTAYHNCLAWHIRCAEPVHLFPPKPSRLLWVCGEVIAALLVNLLAIIVPIALYLVLT